MTSKLVNLSFDDGLKCHFKWARGLWRCGYSATFFVNPAIMDMRLGEALTLDMMKKMHEEWGHTIANHLWLHEAPVCAAMSIIMGNYFYAAEWLTKHGFGDGADLVALPYGNIAGHWTDENIAELLNECSMIRDVAGKDVPYHSGRRIYAFESTDPFVTDSGIVARYFHGNQTLMDEHFVSFLDYLGEQEAKTISLRELADAV